MTSSPLLLLVQLPIPPPGPGAVEGNVPLAAAYLKLFARRQGLADRKKMSLASEPFGGNMGITGTVNAHEDDERELIDRAQAGEAIAFERLAGQHAARLWRVRWPLARIATGPRILRKRRWSKRGDPWRVSTAVAGSPLGYTAFYGTGS